MTRGPRHPRGMTTLAHAEVLHGRPVLLVLLPAALLVAVLVERRARR